MDYAAFSARLKADPDPAPAYCFYGDEPYLMQRGAEIVAERYGLQSAGRLVGEETPWRDVAGTLASTFLLGPRRLIGVVYRENVPADHVRGLESFPAGPTVLGAQFWMKKLPFEPPATALKIKCDRPDDELLGKWARKEFGLRGRRVGGEALEAFVQGMRGRPLHACLSALESISAHAGSGGVVARPDVEPFVGADVQSSAFRICDALAARRPADAHGALRDLLARGEPPLKIHGGIAWGFRQVWDAHLRRARGQNRIEVARSLSVRYGAERYVDLAERMGAAGLRRAFEALLDADRALKSGADETALETLVGRLAEAQANG